MNKRPLFLSILAILHIVGGTLALIAIPIMAIAYYYKKKAAIEGFDSFVILLLGSVFFLAIIALVSGLGMIRGKKWGWWIGSFYYVYGILRNTHALFTISSFAEDLEEPSRDFDYYYMKHGFRVLINLLLLLYFFNGNVVKYFGLEQLSKIKAIIILFTTALIIWGGLAITQLI